MHSREQVSGGLQVGSEAALVPQQAAVTQFNGRNQVCTTLSLRLVTDRQTDRDSQYH